MINYTLGQIVLFVKNVSKSTEFYSSTLNLTPAFQSPVYSMFILKNGIKLGLWDYKDVSPSAISSPGSSEVCFLVDDVDEAYKQLEKNNLRFIQLPTDIDFGRTFVFLDPDDHRIRIYKLQHKS